MAATDKDLQAAINAPPLPERLRKLTTLTFNEYTSLLDFTNFIGAMDVNDPEAVFLLAKDWAAEARVLLTGSAYAYELGNDRGGIQKRSSERVKRVRTSLALEAKLYDAEYYIAEAKRRIEEYQAQEQEVRPHQLEAAGPGFDATLEDAMEDMATAAQTLSIDSAPAEEEGIAEEEQHESNSYVIRPLRVNH